MPMTGSPCSPPSAGDRVQTLRGDEPLTDVSRACLDLEMKSDQLGEFFPILQQGFGVAVRVGCTLAELLSLQWGLSPDYVAQRITTIFLDCRPIDDVNRAVIREGAVIALSGAMPGLVGATMRRGGYYAAMRGGITHQETAADVPARIATVRVKLFNLLLPELGAGFLRRGMSMGASELTDFLVGKPASFWQGCGKSLLNGRAVGPALLQKGEIFPPGATVCLAVNFHEIEV